MQLSSFIIFLGLAYYSSALRCMMQFGMSVKFLSSKFGESSSSREILRSSSTTVVCTGKKASCVTANFANHEFLRGCTHLTKAELAGRLPLGIYFNLCHSDYCNAISTPKTIEAEESEAMEMPSEEFLSILNEKSKEQADAKEEEKTEETQGEFVENPLLEDVVPLCSIACKKGINSCCKAAGYKRGKCIGRVAICVKGRIN